MPVTLEIITNPEQQDLDDLIKIYRDYPQAPANDLGQWVGERLDQGHQCFAARFNGRLLGAVWAAPSSTSNSWQLEYLCVRTVTRRRGVASQLLTLLAQHAAIQALSLTIDQQTISPELKALFGKTSLPSAEHQQPATGAMTG